LAAGLAGLGYGLGADPFFDTLRVELAGGPIGRAADLVAAAAARRINLRLLGETTVGVAIDETTTAADLAALLAVFAGSAAGDSHEGAPAVPDAVAADLPPAHARTSPFLTHAVFHRHHTEHEML